MSLTRPGRHAVSNPSFAVAISLWCWKSYVNHPRRQHLFSDYPGVSIHGEEKSWFCLINCAYNGEDNKRGTLPGSANNHVAHGN